MAFRGSHYIEKNQKRKNEDVISRKPIKIGQRKTSRGLHGRSVHTGGGGRNTKRTLVSGDPTPEDRKGSPRRLFKKPMEWGAGQMKERKRG